MESDDRQSRRGWRQLGELGPAWITAIAALIAALTGVGFFAGRTTAPSTNTAPRTSTAARAPTTPATSGAARAATDESSSPGSAPNLSSMTPVSEDADAAGGFTTGPVQIGTTTYQNSVIFYCGPGFQTHVVYNVAGYSTLSATVGSPNDAQFAVGNNLAVNFLKNGSTQLGPTVNVSVGSPQSIHLDLNGTSQLEITCSGLASTGYTDVALGNAILG